MKRKHVIIPALCLAVVLAAGAAVYAAGTAGSPDDPLITRSYLDAVVQPQLEEELQDQMAAALDGIQVAGDGRFVAVSLSAGQRLSGGVGTELLLRSGSAAALAERDTELTVVDTTTAETLVSGTALSVNHLCLVTVEGGGILAGREGAFVLVSGVYTVS